MSRQFDHETNRPMSGPSSADKTGRTAFASANSKNVSYMFHPCYPPK